MSELSRKYDADGNQKTSKTIAKIQRTKNMKDKTKPVQIPCSVTGCSMMRTHNDYETPMIILYLYRSVLDFKSSKLKSSDKNYSLSIRLCEDHGYLISCVWYLFNQFKIWSFTVFHQLKFFFNSNRIMSIFMAYSIFAHASKEMIKEKERMELSITYIKEWIERNSNNTSQPSSSEV